MPDAAVHICSFEAVEDLRGKALTYENLKAAVLRAGKFSVFEATASSKKAKLFTRLAEDLELELDKSLGFPWTRVKKRDVPLCSACRGSRFTERYEYISPRVIKVHPESCVACNGTGLQCSANGL